MKVIIFGATGTVGRHLVEQAVLAGDEVSAFARRDKPASNGVHWIQGDVLNRLAVSEAVAGHDAVFCALGAGRHGGVRSEGTANIIAAMKDNGVRRLICQSTLGAGDSDGNLTFFWRYFMFGFLLRPAFADHQAQEKHVRNSGLEWTIVRPAAFTDGPLTGRYQHGFSGSSPRGLSLKISRADVAHFMRQQLATDRYLNATPGLSY
ncbi:MAG: SDR family oxidoreductase [Burkholderiaceae bacterium]